MDVDGVLNLAGLLRRGSKFVVGEEVSPGEFEVSGLDFTVRSGSYSVFPLFWRTELPRIVADLSADFDIVWATTWMDAANEVWLDRMGLSEPLPVIGFDLETRPGHFGRLCWKTLEVSRWLADNHGPDVRGVWFDDEVSRYDRALLPPGMRPVTTYDHTGLNDRLVAYAKGWAAGDSPDPGLLKVGRD